MNTASGVMQATGTDANQVLWSTDNAQGKYGELTLNQLTGEWHYQLDNNNQQTNALSEGTHQTEQFVISATDSQGNKVSSVIAVEVEGSNDLPQISGIHHASLNELGSIDTVSGNLIATDPDNGDSITWSASNGIGQFGQLVIDSKSGEWQYVLDNHSATTLALHQGEVAVETFTVTATDSSGTPVSKQVTISINGSNETAQIGGVSSANLTEDKDVHQGQLHVDGALTVTDVDSGQNQFQATSLQGQFGTLSINELGHWTYTADNSQPNIQGLKTGESVTDTVLIHSVDGTEQKITVTINGTDDKAVIAGISTASLTEDKDVHGGQLRVDGALTVTDVDNGQNQFQATSLQGQFGTLSINELGHWTYTADNSQPNIQGLKTGESVTDTVLVHSVDGTEQKITVTINGTDEKAVIAGASTAQLTEDKDVHQGQLRVDGTLTVTDVDNGQNQFQATSLQGQFGTLSINELGHWTYTADNSQPSIQGLKTGESLTDTLVVHSVDGTEQKISVTINGTDDKAVIAGTSTAQLTEDKDLHQGQLHVDGALTVTDLDNGQAQFSATSLQGQFGTLSINNLGHWTYTADNSQSAIQGLKTGESLTDTLIVHSVDGTEQKISVTINGTDDKAVIGGTSTASLTEDKDVHGGQLRVDGALTVTDVDNGQNQFQATSLQGQFGTLSINELGHWTYTADNSQPNIQGLKTGESLTDTLIVHSVDGTEQKVTVTINGTDDKAVVAGTSTAQLTEDKDVHQGQLHVDGALTVTDVDSGQNQFQATVQQGQFGTLSINSLGHWTYTADNSQPTIQGLKTGESLTDTLIVHSVDGTEQKVTVTINGTDDKAVVAGTSTASLTEDKDVHSGQLRVDGALTVTDLDNGQAQFSASSLQGQFGTLSINNLGHWTYTADNSQPAIQGLKTGESLTDTLVVHSVDGTEQKVTVTINGTDDKAVIAGKSTAQLTEDKDVHQGQLHVDGALTVTDLDNGQAQFSAESLQGQFGTLSINNLGHWTYTADNSQSTIQGLKTGESLTDTLVVHSVDGTEQKITVTINGTDDKAVIGGTSSAQLTEDKDVHQGQLHVDGALTVTDVDNGQNQFQATVQQGQFGSLALNELGHWTYTADNSQPSIQSLKTGETVTDTLVVHSIDGTEQQITVTINGTDDKAVITGISTGDVDEGHGSFGDMSPDYAQPGMAKLGQAALTADGKLDIVDPDTGESQFDSKGGAWNNSYHGQYGHLLLNSDGTWHYDVTVGSVDWVGNRKTTIGSTIDKLGEGQTLTDTITIQSKDGTSHDIVITIHGDNDRPYCSSEVVIVNGSEDTRQTLTTAQLLANTVDVDTNDAGLLTIENLHADHGSILNNADGSFTFTPETDYNGSVHFNYDVKDAHGGITHTGASTTLAAVGDAAIITGVDTGSITENSAGVDMSPDYAQPGIATLGNKTLYADGKLTITDPDVGESGFERQGSNGYDYHGTYGDLILLTDGAWHYHADAGHRAAIGARPTTRGTAIDQLGEGQSLTDTITVHSKDGTTHDIVITIHGSNDRPYCSSEVVLQSGSEDTRQTLTTAQLLANTVDVDANDAGKLTIENLHADHGSILINGDGTFTFTPEKDYNGDVHFSYDVKDAHGGVTHTSATTNLAAVNDNPDVTPLTDSVSEGADNHHTLNLLVSATDKDGDALTISHLEYAIDGQPQSGQLPTGITLDTDGHTLIVDATNPAFNHLANGQSQQIAITYQVEDGHGGSTQQTATLTIAGTDDKATLVSNVIQLTETQALDSEFKSYRGQLQLIDPDSGDNTQFVFSGKYLGQGFEPGHLDVWPNGTYQFRLEAVTNRHADDLIGSLHAGESMELPYEIETNDGQKLTIMVKVTGEDTQAKIEVTPYSSLNNHVYEDHTSFGNTTNQLSSGGTLHVIDPDHDQAGFIAQTITTAEGGRFNINAKGHWSYDIDNDKVQHLGAGESFQQTFTVESIDGSAKKDITVTVHGTNDAPVASAEVRLANGLEDSKIVLTPALLLANTTDIDDNDIGKLSIENLQADHGAIALNADGTFTFTPEKDYNGEVHFSYDVKDAHGGVTHTGASTTLAAVNDSALINGQSQASSNVDIFEDGATSRLTGQLTLTDVDSGENQFATISQLAGQYGYLSMDQQGNWSYTLDNSLATTNGLVAGQIVTESFTLTSPDGTASHTINVQIHGHDDTPSVSVNEGGAVKSLDLLGGLSSGTVSHMQFSTDGVHYTNQVPVGFMLAGDGHTLQVDPAHNSYNHLANGIALKVDIKYELQQGAGSNVQTSQQQAQVVVTGTSDRPIIHSFNPHSQQNNGPVTGNLLQGATDVDDGAQLVLDDVQFQDPVTHHYVTVQAGQTHNITGVGVIAISANGDYTFTPNSQFSGQVPNLIYRVTDTNGDYADNSQNNLTIHIDPFQAPIIIAPLAVSLAHDTGSSATDLITQDGALSISGQTAGMQVEYSTDGGAHWSSQFTPVEGLNQLQVRQTDNAGHTSKATSIDFTLDTNVAAPHISLDPITADDVLNQAELSGSVPVTGTVGSEVSVGDNITLTLGTHTYTGAVDAQHRFSIDIPANQLSSHTNISASVTITDTAGNNATATDNHHYSTDTNAAIRVNPITSDNIIEASEHQQAVDITGTVSGVEDGQTVTVTIAGQQHQAVVTQGAWHTSLTAAEVQALPGGTVDVTASVQDLAGNLASIHSPLFISDSANPVPTLSFKTPPTPTGSGSIGSHISGDLVAPPIIQQLSPSLSGAGWAITDGHGHTSTSLQGQYGTLSIDPVTGHVDYVYRQAPTAGNKATGGSHWAGQTTSEEHHDVFQVVYHDAHASNVDVKVNVDVTYVHGHSGHNQTSTHLVGMTITPDTSAAPPPAADMNDVPDDIMTFSASITEDEPSFDEVLAHIGADDESSPEHPEGAHSLNQSGASSPIDHYLQMVGVSHADMNPTPQATVVNDLANVAETLAAPDADMLDANQVDAFENPLDDDNHQQHKDELLADLNDQPDQSDTNQANDDDLLHQALNDMHNQV
nr:VCBS domain-containing protein [Shewanella sp. 10N.286.48.A6]